MFHPRNRNIVFVGSDGGVVRNDGAFEEARGVLDLQDRRSGFYGTGEGSGASADDVLVGDTVNVLENGSVRSSQLDV